MIARVAVFVGIVVLAGAFVPQSSPQTTAPFGQGAVRPGNGIKPPTLVRQVEPKYTPSAMDRKVEGEVELEAVIATDGTVSETRVTRSLDPDLDLQAVAAARQWVFNPGTDPSGTPVAVIVTLMMSFRLSPGNGDGFLTGVCTDAPDLVQPTLVWSIEPKYTADAIRQKIQGQVVVEAVVDPSGVVARARVAESLDKVYGLDDAALAAAKQFRFKPNSGSCHGGLPTWTLAKLTLDFRIH
jgi:TonB family protein